MPLWITVATAALGAAALQPWAPPAGTGGRTAWVAVQQATVVVLVILAWQAPDLTGVGDRLVARMIGVAVALQLVTSVWNNQLGGSYQWYGTALDDVVRGTLTAATGAATVTAFAVITRRRVRTAGHDVTAIVDALVVSTAIGIVVWEALAARVAATDATITSIALASAIVIASTAVSIRLLLSSARRTAAVRLLAASLLSAGVATARFATLALAGLPPRDGWGELALLVTFSTAVAAILHPSMRTLLDGADHETLASDSTVRAATLCVATVVPAAVTLIRALEAAAASAGRGLWTAVTVPSAAAGVALTVGVAWRLAQLVRDRERARVLLEHRSRHDDLTGLPNRAFLLERLDREVRRVGAADQATAPGFGLMFLDLDGFKAINDNYGHHAGDAVLVAVAQRLGDVVRTDDFVARMAGDEFVLLCAEPADEPSLTKLADRIRTAIEAPLPADFGVVTPEVSIGVAAVDRSTVTSTDAVSAILRRADDAMYAAKREARARETPAPRPVRPADGHREDAASDVDRVS